MNKPFFLRPAGKDYLWGGNRLNDDFSKGIDMEPLAETWECSTHPDGPSMVASGVFAGRELRSVLHEYPAYLGTHPRKVLQSHGLSDDQLPILVKLIDARKDLSIQVHPDDAYAAEHGLGLGKTEMWYVLDASRDAKLVYGLNRDMSKEELRKAVEDGTVGKCLQKVPIRKDDVFYIPAGTIHAIGAGALVAEIQESSNLTYRLYDYGRLGKDKKPRELHVEQALAVADLREKERPTQPMRVLKYRRGCATELLCRCEYFMVERVLLNTERCRELVAYKSGSGSFAVLLCVDGCGMIGWGGENHPFFKGDCVFVPADSTECVLHGRAQLLKVGG